MIYSALGAFRLTKARLERNPQPQTDRTAAVDSFLRKGRRCMPKAEHRIVVTPDSGEGWHLGIRIDRNAKRTEIRETAVSKIQIRHPDRVIEDVIEVGAESGRYSLPKFKVLVQPKIDAPGSRPPQEVLSGDCRIIKNVRSHRRRSKRIW